jgi:coenzyme F420-reducing hydrogenase delta subunit
VKYVQQLLKQIGLQEERVRMFNMSAAMAGQFVASVQEMTEHVSLLGPNPLKKVITPEE